MKFNPFPAVGNRYGSPMGRPNDAPGNFVDAPRSALRAMHEHEGASPDSIDPGYDKGGAYWGLPDDVWAVWIDDPNEDRAVTYVRAMSAEEAIDKVRGIELDEFTQAYIEAIYFTDGQGIYGDEFDADTMLSPEAFRDIKADCAKFQADAHYLLAQAYAQDGYDAAQAGHDFWLTRNGHGAGFWDRGLSKVLGQALTDAAHAAGGLHPYKGDDGLVHMEAV